ncbi:hypothetical protein D3C76_1762610 [compost metagenome]
MKTEILTDTELNIILLRVVDVVQVSIQRNNIFFFQSILTVFILIIHKLIETNNVYSKIAAILYVALQNIAGKIPLPNCKR